MNQIDQMAYYKQKYGQNLLDLAAMRACNSCYSLLECCKQISGDLTPFEKPKPKYPRYFSWD